VVRSQARVDEIIADAGKSVAIGYSARGTDQHYAE